MDDERKIPLSQRIAERIAGAIGFKFLVIQTIIIMLWIGVNVSAMFHRFDPYPFILLNLALSLQAAAATPILMIANKRQERIAREMNQETHDRVEYMYNEIKKAHEAHSDKLDAVHAEVKEQNK